MERCIIVAIADNNAIGKDNALLWHISDDMKFFRHQTVGCPVIMGNAPQELRTRYARVAPDNDHDGIAVMLKELL